MASEIARRPRRESCRQHSRSSLFFVGAWLAFSWLILFLGSEGEGAREATVPAEVGESLSKLYHQFRLRLEELAVIVDVSEQKMYLIKEGRVFRCYAVSTSRYGVGSEEGSYQTPLGTHRVFEKIGRRAPLGAIFRQGKETGRIAEIRYDPIPMEGDLITTRVLRLSGQEAGRNRGARIDSLRRGIWIHGTPEEGFIGTPRSKGCIRMRNRDIVELFGLLPVGTLVEIRP